MAFRRGQGWSGPSGGGLGRPFLLGGSWLPPRGPASLLSFEGGGAVGIDRPGLAARSDRCTRVLTVVRGKGRTSGVDVGEGFGAGFVAFGAGFGVGSGAGATEALNAAAP